MYNPTTYNCAYTPIDNIKSIYNYVEKESIKFPRGGQTCTCILYTFKNISCEPINYSTKSALMGLNGVDYSALHKLQGDIVFRLLTYFVWLIIQITHFAW